METAKVREKADAAVEMFKEEHKTKSSDLSLSQNKASKLKVNYFIEALQRIPGYWLL